MAVTIKDIAKAVGVSHTTVSRALRDSPLISEETRQRVHVAAKQMGYTPSAVAQSLKTKRTRTIGMVVSSLADPFMSRVVDGVENVAQRKGYNIFLSASQSDPDRETQVVDVFHHRRVDAVIVAASRVGCQYGQGCTGYQGPIVLINNEADEAYQQAVNIDNQQGGYQAVSHLIGLGHQKIAYIGSAQRPHTNACRLAGYQKAFQQAGLAWSAGWVAQAGPEADLKRAEVTLDALLGAGVTGVFCFNDMIAIGVLEACRKRGLQVPQDLSVVGFDDIETGRYVSPPLTTIRQPRFEMGQRAMEMVLRLLQKQSIRPQILPGKLILRESTQAVG